MLLFGDKSGHNYSVAKAQYEHKVDLLRSYEHQGLINDAHRLEEQVSKAKANMDKALADYTIANLK